MILERYSKNKKFLGIVFVSLMLVGLLLLTAPKFLRAPEKAGPEILPGFGDNRNGAGDNPLAWEAIKAAIDDCRAKGVFQSHSREVVVDLKDGGELRAIEPELDDIIDLALAAEAKCGRIRMATE